MRERPLAGYRIGVTADRRADEQMQLLENRGADCLHGAVIKTHAIDEASVLASTTAQVIEHRPDRVVFTTGLGVRGWLEAADSVHLGEELREVLSGAELFARGPKAKGALSIEGLSIATDTPLARYQDVIDTFAESGVAGLRVAVQLDGAGATALCDAIEELGAQVLRVPVYRWSLPDNLDDADRLVQAVAEQRIDAVTFTAKPAVDNFFDIASMAGCLDEVRAALDSGAVSPVCVGPVCASGITEVGLAPPLVPERFRLGAMVQMLAQHFAEQGADIELGGTTVRLQGRMAHLPGEEPTWLTDRERSVLDALLERPGAVLSKQELLRRVWSGREKDEHVVEVTVARLRQRLGVASVGIETVIRRGYRVSAQ